MKQKILTISIAAYNSEKYLVKCLDSLTGCKTLDKVEILVINDGSTDLTQVIAEEYQDRYPESIIVVNKENGGHGSTINCAIKLATGIYFKIVDADDWVSSEGIDNLVRFLEKATVDLVLNPYTNVDINGEITKIKPCLKLANAIEYDKVYGIKEVQNAINLQIYTSTFRTEILKSIKQPISEHCYYVDVEYVLYPIQDVHTVVFFNYVIYRYLLGTSDQSVNMSNKIIRRDQHMHVTKTVIEFYYSQKEKKNMNGITLIYNRVVGMIRNQYEIYFGMKDTKTSKKELMQFDHYLKNECFDMYCDVSVQDKYMSKYLIVFFRKMNFHGYGLVIRLLHFVGLGI